MSQPDEITPDVAFVACLDRLKRTTEQLVVTEAQVMDLKKRLRDSEARCEQLAERVDVLEAEGVEDGT